MEIKTDLSSILRSSFVFALLISGVYFVFNGLLDPSITGSVVGAQNASYSVVIGVVLLVATLALTFHHDKSYKSQIQEINKR